MASFREFLSMPMGAGPMARPVGMDELGNVVNRPVLGPDYRVVQQPPNRQSVTRGFLGALMDDPAGTIGNALSGAAQGAWDAFSAPGRAASGENVTMGDVVDVAGMVSLPALVGKYDPAVANMGIRAYHGSPHDFDRFSMDKIGTGEGAQAYGHGLYFAEAEDVARSYKEALGGRAVDRSADAGTLGGRAYKDLNPEERAAVRMAGDWGDPQLAADNAVRQGLIERAGILNKMASGEIPYTINKGHMYEVDINADPADFLDWDAPLSEQPASAHRAIQEILGVPTSAPDAVVDLPNGRFGLSSGGAPYGRPDGWPDRATAEYALKAATEDAPAGKSLGQVMGRAASPAHKSDQMREAGIPGIKYRDAGSRGIDGAEGVSRNYVVFDDSLIDIIRKYGLAGAMLGFGYPQENQQ